MNSVPYKIRQKAKSSKLVMAFIFVCSFLWADFSFADSWSCSPPPNDAVEAVIAKYPSSYLVSRNQYIIRLVEGSLERRLGFKSELVSCEGSSCRINAELIKFIGRRNIGIPEGSTPMSICSAHNSDCSYKNCQRKYPDRYDVIYAWKYGTMRLILEVSKSNNKLLINKIVSDDVGFEPILTGYHSRYIGVARNAGLSIEISIYPNDYFE